MEKEEEEHPSENGTGVIPEPKETDTVVLRIQQPNGGHTTQDDEEHHAAADIPLSEEKEIPLIKRPRLDAATHDLFLDAAAAAASSSNPHSWKNPPPPPAVVHQPSTTMVSSSSSHPSSLPRSESLPRYRGWLLNTPYYVSPFPPPNFVPTWKQLIPPSTGGGGNHSVIPSLPPPPPPPPPLKFFRLSLLNVNEFTMEGLSPRPDLPRTSIHGLRVPIRQISRPHGKAVYDKEGGKWRIPLGAYQDLAGFLLSDPGTRVLGIPPNQLQIASLEKARQEKGYPTAEKLVEYGVPAGLAAALAPFQRGGVDFVQEKQGRAWIADDMGLGKSIQGVASMSIYWKEWPVLVLCPSGARYHWESEFKQWLGINSPINHPGEENSCPKEDDNDEGNVPHHHHHPREWDGPLLKDEQIHVLTSARSPIFPRTDTQVVICSYGLSSVLIESGKLTVRQFRCAIVDESHMLKNKTTKRTSLLLPLLNATDRCVLLSGTPALAKPLELWPQLAILRTEQHGWGAGNEHEFIEKYVKNGSAQRSAELHTMLRGTVMIRRLKNDILKTLPRKVREKAEVHVIVHEEQRTEFMKLLMQLRESKGAMGNLARLHQAELEHARAAEGPVELVVPEPLLEPTDDVTSQLQVQKAQATAQLNSEIQQQWTSGQNQIRQTVEQQLSHLDIDDRRNAMLQMEGQLRTNLQSFANEKMRIIDAAYSQQLEEVKEKEEHKRTTLLSRLYSLTGDVKIPLIVDSLKQWLADPTKGKVCIFAHHLSVLDAIRDGVGLSNDSEDRKRRFIRIDGSTLPKIRQEQIVAFQNDLSIRVALLGITAAGVAVTLTASSTVWFAELFWTPAIMIQAEDRCHRIGQTAKVNCLYFVAKGTLDDVLWKLLEKKFRDLGEFVEGKEKLKLVVDKVYQGHKEFHSSVFGSDTFDDSDSLNGEEEIDFSEEMQLDNVLFHDIEELGEEEQRMLQVSDPDVDDVDNALEANTDVLDGKPIASESIPTENGLGKSEDDAISLSDDESEGPSNVNDQMSKANNLSTPKESHGNILNGCRVYRIVFGEVKLGLEFIYFEGHIVVTRLLPERLSKFGPNSKPGVGDILCSIDGQSLGLIPELSTTIAYLRALLSKHPVEVMFMEAPKFVSSFCTMIERRSQKQDESNALAPAMYISRDGIPKQPDHVTQPVEMDSSSRLSMKNEPHNDVIELLDDD